jgi:HlyD family secretion protein
MKNIKILILGASALFLSSCGNKDIRYDASGTFEASEIIVSSESSGKILQFDVQEGQPLDSGQFVGYIDSTQLYLKKLQLLAGMKALQIRRPEINKQIAALQQQITTAKTEKVRIENLVKANAVNQKQLDDKCTDFIS